MTHIVKRYAGGIGHIDSTGTGFRISFYGRRIVQQNVATLAEARHALRLLAKNSTISR